MNPCCTSAPPTTRMSVEPAMTGHALGATKHTWGLRPGTCSGPGSAPVAEGSRPPISGGFVDDISAYVVQVDTFELQEGLVDAGLLSQPGRFLGDDLLPHR